MRFIYILILALLMTILIEFLVYLILTNKRVPELLLYSTLINAFTNPLLNYAYSYLNYDLILLEGLVVAVEALLIAGLMSLQPKDCLMVSFFANLASAVAGVLFFAG